MLTNITAKSKLRLLKDICHVRFFELLVYYLPLFTFLLDKEPYIYDVHAKLGLGRSEICHLSGNFIVFKE